MAELRTLFQPEERVEGKPLGRHVVHDPRSRDYPAMEAVWARRKRPKAGWWRQPIFDQGNTSSCTVQATAGQLVSSPYRRALTRAALEKLLRADFRQEQYLIAQYHDPWAGGEPPQTPVYYGSSGLAACKALVLAHVVPDGWTYRWAFGGDEAMAALEIGPISVGTWWYEGFDRPDRHGRVRKEGQRRGGHQWEVVHANDEDVFGVNSWGPGWGVRGRFRMPRREFYELLEEDGDVVVWAPPF